MLLRVLKPPVTFAVLLSLAGLAATGPATRPPSRPATTPATTPAPSTTRSTGDAALDFLLDPAVAVTSRPATSQPATKPTNPFDNRRDAAGIRDGVLHLSSGEKIRGRLATTEGRPIRVWVEKEQAYRDIPFRLIASAEAKLLWERDEKEWRFKESGSDLKEYSGRTYPARELEYTITLTDGTKVHGAVVAPIYLQTKEGHVTFILHKRQKGEIGQTVKELVYVARVELE